jgi:hypothetical protein
MQTTTVFFARNWEPCNRLGRATLFFLSWTASAFCTTISHWDVSVRPHSYENNTLLIAILLYYWADDQSNHHLIPPLFSLRYEGVSLLLPYLYARKWDLFTASFCASVCCSTLMILKQQWPMSSKTATTCFTTAFLNLWSANMREVVRRQT